LSLPPSTLTDETLAVAFEIVVGRRRRRDDEV
jgi:hypothetical protein